MEVNVEKLPVPSISELLGYLAPGAAALGVVYLAEAYLATVDGRFAAPLHAAAGLLGWGVMPDGWILQALVAVAILLLCYLAGHLIDSVGKLFIDRTLIFKGYGYPYQYLLDLPTAEQRAEKALVTRKWRTALRMARPNAGNLAEAVIAKVRDTPKRSDISASFYRGFFFWFNLYLLVRWLGFLRAASVGPANYWWSFADILGFWCALLILTKLFGGHTLRRLVRDVHDEIGSAAARRWKRWVLLVYRAAAIGLYEVVAAPLGKMLKTRRSLPQIDG